MNEEIKCQEAIIIKLTKFQYISVSLVLQIIKLLFNKAASHLIPFYANAANLLRQAAIWEELAGNKHLISYCDLYFLADTAPASGSNTAAMIAQ